jgi:fatty-acyl-CoA synthase
MNDTLPHRLQIAANNGSDEQGLVFVDRRSNEVHFNWDRINTRSLQVAYQLDSRGVSFNDRVAIILPTCIEFIDAFLGLQQLGAIPVPMYPPLRLGKLEEYFSRTIAMLSAANITAIITNKQIARILGQIVAKYPLKNGLHKVEGIALKELFLPIEITENQLAMAQFSSGTTNTPKPVGLTHQQVLSNTDRILDFVKGNVGCSWLPLYHDMGLIGCIFPAITRPGKLALIPPEVFLAKPAIWLQTISRHKAYISPAPNFAYSYCAQRIKDSDLKGVDLSPWELALNGAEAVAPEHLRSFNKRFAPYGLRKSTMTPVYGLAEAALAVTFSDPNSPFTSRMFDLKSMREGKAVEGGTVELTTVGTPLRDFQIEIRNEHDELLSDGRIGKIHVNGPSVMEGYLNDAPSPIKDGWLDTGDIGFIYKEELYICGREKDVIILNGQNHAPQDIEQAVDKVEGIRTGCSVAVGDISPEGERIYLFVEYKKIVEDMAQACQRAVLSKTGIKVDLIVLLESGTLPRTSSGKLKRRETLRLFKEDQLFPPKKVNSLLLAGAMAKSTLGYLQSRWT